ncbi:MAG: gluconate 2-dehydrogenase subunit 3 family protein [Gemmatimonadota bacterium]
MHQGEIARRQFLRLSANAISGVWIAAALGEVAGGVVLSCAPAPHTGAWRTFTDADATVVDSIAALIIPTDDTPGAREAGVVHFIDRSLETFARDQRPLFEKGLADLKERVKAAHPSVDSFVKLDVTQQSALLHLLEKEKSEFFAAMLAATTAGMFANPEYGGNQDKIGWKMIGFEDRFFWQQPFGYYDRDEVTHA